MDERLGDNLIELGRLQDALKQSGHEAAARAGDRWEEWVRELLSEDASDLLVRRARSLAAEAAADLVRLGLLASPAVLWDDVAAKVLRGIRVEPAKLLRHWHALGRAADVPSPGDYLTARVVQEPVVVVRQDDGSIRCFLNVCPHRSAELMVGQGRLMQGRMTCGYHGWCFDASGSCTSVPGRRRGEFGNDFSPREWGLRELRCRVSDGWIHVAFDGEPPGPPFPPPVGSVPAAQLLARLLQTVRPGCPRVKAPEVDAVVRYHLRLGRTAGQLERRLAEIARRRGPSAAGLATNLLLAEVDPAERAELRCLGIELRQCLIDTGRGASRYRPLLAAGQGEVAAEGLPAAEPPGPGPVRALPCSVYGDPALFVAEVDKLIKPTWQFLGHVKELRKPGDLVSLDIAGETLCVFRGADGALAAGVLREPWSQPRADEVVDVAEFGDRLDPAELEVWNGLLFVRLAGDGLPVAEVWEHPGLLVPYRIAEMVPLRGGGWYDFDIEVDTKVLWENFLELYHFPIAHKSLSRLFRMVPKSDLMPLRRRPSPQCTPEERSYFDNLHASAPHSLEHEEQLRAQAEEYKQLDAPFHFTVFGSIPLLRRAPITLGLTVFPDHLQAMSFIPIGPRECRIRIRSYGHPIDTGTKRGRALAAARRVNVDVLQVELVEEDILVNYLSEGGTSSRLNARAGILAAIEVSVRDFQQTLRNILPGGDAHP